MEKIVYLREDSLETLRIGIAANLSRYESAAPWLEAFFAGGRWTYESNRVTAPPFTLSIPASRAVFTETDLENTRIVYEALRQLTPLQAAQPRLWAYMTHHTYWDYMRRRWAIEGDTDRDAASFIRERYFFGPNLARALVRNGIARLWWYGYCSYDAKRSDSFELTAVLLKNLDIAQSILERSFSLNISVTQTLLEALLERDQRQRPFYNREKVRVLARHLVRVGGVTILDALDKRDLRALIDAKIDQLEAA